MTTFDFGFGKWVEFRGIGSMEEWSDETPAVGYKERDVWARGISYAFLLLCFPLLHSASLWFSVFGK